MFSRAVCLLTKQESLQHFRHLGVSEASSVVDNHNLRAPVQLLSWGSWLTNSALAKEVMHGTGAFGAIKCPSATFSPLVMRFQIILPPFQWQWEPLLDFLFNSYIMYKILSLKANSRHWICMSVWVLCPWGCPLAGRLDPWCPVHHTAWVRSLIGSSLLGW